MTAARARNTRQGSSSIINQRAVVIFMQISERDYQHNPPLSQAIATAASQPA
jgi:hypothetical protein